MANYKENFASKLDWAMPFQRTGAFPLDRSNLFESLADAQLYAQGGADKRGLGGTSYVGQMIVVYENDVVTAYIINADRSLKAMASTASDGSSVQSVLDALNAHKAAYDAKVKELENADKAISGRLDIIEGEANVEGSIKKALADAKAYADTQDITLHETISTEIDDDVKVVSDALSGEITRAKAAEKANADAIATEKARAEGKEVEIKSLLDAEVTRATEADTAHKAVLDKLDGDENTEGSVKNQIKVAVEAEKTARENADTALGNRIAKFEAGGEKDVSKLATDLADEASRAKAAEEVLTNNLAAEVTRAKEAEKTLTDNLAKEIERATNAENGLSGKINIINGEANVEGSIKHAVAVEAKSREDKDKELKSAIDAINENLGATGSIGNRLSTVEGKATALEERADTLEGKVSNLETAVGTKAVDADDEHGIVAKPATGLYKEVDNLKAADAALDSRLDSLEGIVGNAQSGLVKKVDDNTAAIAAINHETDGILAKAKKYTDDELDTAIGVAPSETVTGSGLLKDIADAEKSAKGYADQKIAALVNGAPETLDTLKELADALKNDADFATTVSTEIGKKADKTYVDTELGKKVDKVEGSRLVTETEADTWGAKAEVAQVNQALTDAKGYTDSEIAKITTGDGSIGARLAAVEEKNTEQDTAIANAQAQADKGVADAATEKARAEAAELGLQNAIDAINDVNTGILAKAKSYTNTEVKKVSDKVGDTNDLTTVATNTVSAINELKGDIDAINNADSGILQQAKNYTDGKVGDLNVLTTTAKGSAVSAINELKGKIDSINEDLGTTGSIGTRLNNLETTVGDAQSGLVKDVADLKTADTELESKLNNLKNVVENAESGLVKKVADNAAAIATNANNITTNTNAIAAINNEQTGILAQAKEDATTKANNAKNDAITEAGKLDVALKDEIEGDNGKLMKAIKAEVTRATEAENNLSGKIDIINGEGEGSFKKAITDEKTARENADKALGDRIAKFEAGGENDVSKLKTDLANEVTRAKAAEKENKDAITVLNGADTVEGSVAKTVAEAVAGEASLREAADTALDGRLDIIEASIKDDGSLGSRVKANEDKLRTIQGEGEGSIKKALEDAKAHTNTAVANLVNSAPEALDTLQELANALGDDPNFATTVATQIGTKVDKVENHRLVSTEEIAKWNAKAEVSDVTAEKDRAEAAELELKNAIGAINNTNTGILAEAKKYADDQDKKLAGKYNTAAANEESNASGLRKEIEERIAAEAKLRSDADTTLSNRIANKADKEHGNHVPEIQDTVSSKVFLRNDNTWATITPENIGAAKASHGIHVEYAIEQPKAPGKAAAGTSDKVAREDHVHPLQTTITGNAGTATKLATARTITVKGDATGSVSFDGSENKDLNLTLSNSGVATGSYGPTGDVAPNYEGIFVVPQVTVDIKGRVTSAANRTITLPAQTVYENATSSKAGLMSNEDKAKLDGIEANANNYIHPKSHPASMITESTDKRFVSDDEKADWNAKETTDGAQSKADTAAANALQSAKKYADDKITALVNGAPAAMDTLKELADAIDAHQDVYDSYVQTVSTELAKKVDKVEGSRLVSETEIARWNAKAEVSQVNQALSDAKDYTDSEIIKITTGDGSIGTRLTAVETKNTEQDTAISNNATNLAKEIERAKAAEEANAGAISTNATNIANNKSVLDKLDGSVTTDGSVKKQIKDAIDGITTGEGSIGTRLTAVETKNTEQDTAINTNKTNIANNKSALDILNGSVTTEGSVKKQISDAIEEITTGDGGIEARLTAIETKNTKQDTAIANAQKQADKGVADAAAEATRAQAAEKVLTDNLAAEVTRATNAETANKNAITVNSNAITVLNGDSTVEGSVDKKIADNNIFDTDILTVNELGGIKAGENLNGMTIEEVLKKLLYPYVAHLVSASSSPDGGVFECGSTQTVTRITANITKKSEPITKVEFVDGSTILETKTNGVEAGGSVIHNCSITVSTNNKSFTVNVTDKSGKVVTATTGKFTFVYPYYWGVCANDATINEAMVKGLTKKVETKGQKGVTYTANFQRAVIAYPASYGDIRKILDPNSFDVTTTFTKHSINVTGLDGKSVAYYVYVNSAFTATNFKFTFSY